MKDIVLQTYVAILPVILPMILLAIGEFLRRLIARLAAGFEARTGVAVDAKAMATLHSALMTGITAALSRGLTGQEAINAGIGHALARGAPDAIRHFGLTTEGLQTLAEAKLWEAQSRGPLLEFVAAESGVFGPIGAQIEDETPA